VIDAIIGLGLTNLRDTRYVNASVKLLFHFRPLMLTIVTWPNRDPIFSALRLMFGAMFQGQFIDVVSLSTVCKPDLVDGRDCLELPLQMLRAFRDASSGTLRDIIEQLFCFRQIARFSTAFSSRYVSGRPLFFWHLPVSRSSTLIEYLSSHFRIIQLDAESPQTQQNFSRSFPMFFLSLDRCARTNNHMVKDCNRVIFPVVLDMIPCTFQTENRYPYQLTAVICHLAIPGMIRASTRRFSGYSADGFNLISLRSRLARNRQHYRKFSQKQRDPINCYYPALYGRQLPKWFNKQFLNQMPSLSSHKSSSID
jgi:hypothetical protein